MSNASQEKSRGGHRACNKLYIPLCFLAIPVQIALASGWNDYSTKLPGGYELVRTNASSIMIYGRDTGFVVPPKIVALNFHGRIVFGKIERSSFPDLPSTPGYFVLNTKRESVELGLDEQAWLNRLSQLGITKQPSLIKPSRFFILKVFVGRFFKASPILLCVVLIGLILYGRWKKTSKRHASGNAGYEAITNSPRD